MNLLAIDPATVCGFAKVVDGKISYSSQDFHNKQWDGAGMRFLKFRKYLAKEIQTNRLDMVVYEKVENHPGGGTHASHMYGGWLSHLQEICEGYKIPYDAFGVQEIKKFWTGKSGASKKEMIKEARKRGFNPKDDNDADALAILHLGLYKYEALFL